MIAIVLGPDAALARSVVRDIVRESDPAGENTTAIDGKAVSVNDVMMAAASVGFFSAGRTIVVDDLIARHGKGTGKGSEADWQVLFRSVPESTTLVLVDPSVATLPAALKKMLPGDARVIASDPPRGRDLIDWIRQRAQAEGGQIDQQTATFLANTLFPGTWSERNRNPAFDRPPDMDALGNEIAKLVTAALPGPVTREHVGSLTDAGENDNIFAFIDAVMAGNLARAIPALDALIANGEDPHRILAQLAGSVELAAVMERAGGRDPVAVGKDLKLSNPARMSAIARSVRNLPAGAGVQATMVLEETDRGIKTGMLRDPVDALYQAVARLGTLRPSRAY
jgi:DNA polymerase III delta subunit